MTTKQRRLMMAFSATVTAALVFALLMDSRDSAAQVLTQTKCDRACLQAKVDRHLLLMGEVGRDPALQSSLKDLAGNGPPVIRVVHDTYNRWTRSGLSDPKVGARPAEMRWRAVHLMGTLSIPDAIPTLFEIARRPLPDPRAGENEYADEYRIRLRSIVGLEKLKAVDELKQLHELGGVLRNPTAASLFVLGVNVGRVSRVDVKKALAEDTADYKDHNPGKGRPAQAIKPGRERTSPKRRPDTPMVLSRNKGE